MHDTYIGGCFRWTKITCKASDVAEKSAILTYCSVLPPEIVMHDDAYIGRRSENNIKCALHDDLGQKNHTTRYILLRHWLYEWFSQFHCCGTYLVLSWSHSIIISTTDWFHSVFIIFSYLTVYYVALLPRRGPHIASHSLCPSVPLSLPWVTTFRQPLASRMYFSARTEGIRTFRHALRAAYRTAISAVQILVIYFIFSWILSVS